MNKQNINELLVLDEQQLLQLLGDELIGLNAEKFDKKKKINMAKKWLSENRQLLIKKICNCDDIKELLSVDKKFDNIIIVTAIANYLSALVDIVSPLTIAVLIFKMGIQNLCKGFWDTSTVG